MLFSSFVVGLVLFHNLAGRQKKKTQRISVMRERNRRLTEAHWSRVKTTLPALGSATTRRQSSPEISWQTRPPQIPPLVFARWPTNTGAFLRSGCVACLDEMIQWFNCPTLDSIVPCDKTLFRQRTEDNEKFGMPTCNMRADKLNCLKDASDVVVKLFLEKSFLHFYACRIHTAPPAGLFQESFSGL